MNKSQISISRVLEKLDEYFAKNDYESAEKHLLYWLNEASALGDFRSELPIRNELMGLYRKLGKKEQALDMTNCALDLISRAEISETVASATTYLNCATVYKAFGMSKKALTVFEKAKKIYESELDSTDFRLGGLYNNMALALVDEKRFCEAREFYEKAISVMSANEGKELEVAITHLNIASASESEFGLENSQTEVENRLKIAQNILDTYQNRDGYYAFVCEKCASVFGYYGYFAYENELMERARRIYGEN
jgi:tetratricopeptide (TPR) repeat protein